MCEGPDGVGESGKFPEPKEGRCGWRPVSKRESARKGGRRGDKEGPGQQSSVTEFGFHPKCRRLR